MSKKSMEFFVPIDVKTERSSKLYIEVGNQKVYLGGTIICAGNKYRLTSLGTGGLVRLKFVECLLDAPYSCTGSITASQGYKRSKCQRTKITKQPRRKKNYDSR